MKNIDQLIEKVAPMRTGPRGIEFFNAEGLAARLGVTAADLEELLDAGVLVPAGKGKDGKLPYESAKLNEIRRRIVGEGLQGLASEMQLGDDPGSERKFVQVAKAALDLRRRETMQGKAQAKEFSMRENALFQKMEQAAFRTTHHFAAGLVAPVFARIGRALVGMWKRAPRKEIGAASVAAGTLGSVAIGSDVGAAAGRGVVKTVRRHPVHGHYMASKDHEFGHFTLSRKERDWQPIDPQRLTGKVQIDRYRKSMQDEDLRRRDSNLLRSGAAGAVAGALLPFGKFGRLKAAHRALIGAGAAAAGYTGVRQVTKGTEDLYGDKSREAKRVEDLTPAAIAAAGGYGALRIARRALRFGGKISRDEQTELFEFAQRFTGRDPRVIFGKREARRSENIEFVAAHLVRGFIGQGSRLVGAGRKLRNNFGKIAGIGAGVGAGVGGLRAATDDDPETGILGGALAGALGGAAIGGGAALVGAAGAGALGRAAAAVRARRMRQGMPSMKMVAGRVVS